MVCFSLQHRESRSLPAKELKLLKFALKDIKCVIWAYPKLFSAKKLNFLQHAIRNIKCRNTVARGTINDALSVQYRKIRPFGCKTLHTLPIEKKRVNRKVFCDFIRNLCQNLMKNRKEIPRTLIYRPARMLAGRIQVTIRLKDTLQSKQIINEFAHRYALNKMSVPLQMTVWVNMYYLNEKVRDVLQIKKLFPVIKLYNRKDGITLRTGDVKVKFNRKNCIDEYCGLLYKRLAMVEK
ncbi:DNA phosphorothioation-dependent restriction protein DptG [Vavraia culicis subsp. floridensis]|uniref:DNA phosphorothioation-dependent restriction protein DptG n=1 Tax=Vavraia culicis (isolate floridensis) TaxID=948595 RepID=L2GWE2_VAVCU|nr:DNA phosphorothioation-dependent restriction protein DptG [Vavraia culicis subsp. floridensis]ELA47991.1 DNA phosphorothioation-dependent restriction protein DptG [Vavraia culicis subsp. floridensis]